MEDKSNFQFDAHGHLLLVMIFTGCSAHGKSTRGLYQAKSSLPELFLSPPPPNIGSEGKTHVNPFSNTPSNQHTHTHTLLLYLLTLRRLQESVFSFSEFYTRPAKADLVHKEYLIALGRICGWLLFSECKNISWFL